METDSLYEQRYKGSEALVVELSNSDRALITEVVPPRFQLEIIYIGVP